MGVDDINKTSIRAVKAVITIGPVEAEAGRVQTCGREGCINILYVSWLYLPDLY